jgi:hypothetical protein
MTKSLPSRARDASAIALSREQSQVAQRWSVSRTADGRELPMPSVSGRDGQDASCTRRRTEDLAINKRGKPNEPRQTGLRRVLDATKLIKAKSPGLLEKATLAASEIAKKRGDGGHMP